MRRSRASLKALLRCAVVICIGASSLVIGSQPVSAVMGGVSAVGNTAVVRIINGSSSCSGALWTSRIVITAAHCVVTADGTVTTSPVFVYAPGVDTDISRQTVSQSAIISVDGWQKNVDNRAQADDIAFLVLGTALAGVSISRLATTSEVAAWSRESRVVTFIGYGRTSPTSSVSPTPNAIDQPLNTLSLWPGSFSADQTTTSGICQGDSGGPVITREGNELVLIGINSAASGACQTSGLGRSAMTGFMPSAFPTLVSQALELTGSMLTPLVVTGAASAIASDAATLSGTVNANSLATQAYFQYSRVADFSVLEGSVLAGDVTGTETATLSAPISGIEAGVTYYWRLGATNTSGTTFGDTRAFITPVFGRPTSLTTNGLLKALTIDRKGVTKTVITPTSKSRPHCAFSSRTNRLTFARPGVCRVQVITTRNKVVARGVYNLVVK